MQASEHDRFEMLVLPHLDAAYNLARWLTRDAHDAEDVVQDACIRAMRYVGSLHGSDARPWFLAIVRNAFYDWLGRNRRPEIEFDNGAVDTAVDLLASDPQQSASRAGDLRVLADAIAALPLQFREVLIMRELEELSYKEIARVIDAPIGTVMSRLARARELLRRCMPLYAVTDRITGNER